jgi:CBS domain-containing protein
MKTEVQTVGPDMPVAELERTLIERGVSGFPVLDSGKLVGIVSRSDIVRTLNVERAYDEQISDHYDELAASSKSQVGDGPNQTEARVGARLGGLRVGDAMVKNVLTADPDQTISEVARLLVERGIHRLPVTEDGALVGIITSLDLVRLIGEGRYRAT